MKYLIVLLLISVFKFKYNRGKFLKLDVKVLQLHVYDYGLWFRVFGFGLSVSKTPNLFSQTSLRFGRDKSWKLVPLVPYFRGMINRVRSVWTRCERCQGLGAFRRHQMTIYYEDAANYMNLCPDCQRGQDEYWREQWKEYRREAL